MDVTACLTCLTCKCSVKAKPKLINTIKQPEMQGPQYRLKRQVHNTWRCSVNKWLATGRTRLALDVALVADHLALRLALCIYGTRLRVGVQASISDTAVPCICGTHIITILPRRMPPGLHLSYCSLEACVNTQRAQYSTTEHCKRGVCDWHVHTRVTARHTQYVVGPCLVLRDGQLRRDVHQRLRDQAALVGLDQRVPRDGRRRVLDLLSPKFACVPQR